MRHNLRVEIGGCEHYLKIRIYTSIQITLATLRFVNTYMFCIYKEAHHVSYMTPFEIISRSKLINCISSPPRKSSNEQLSRLYHNLPSLVD